MHWRGSAHGFPRGEAVERSETEEECGQKAYIYAFVETSSST